MREDLSPIGLISQGKKIVSKRFSELLGKQKEKTDETDSPWLPIITNSKSLWESTLQKKDTGKKILIATSMGGYFHADVVESVLSVTLTLRGARVSILLDDGALHRCQLTKFPVVLPAEVIDDRISKKCRSCTNEGKRWFEPLGLPIIWYSQLLDEDSIEHAKEIAGSIYLPDIRSYEYDTIAVGEHAYAGALRYYAVGDLNYEPEGEHILRKYLESSLLTTFAIEELLKRNTFDVACFHHGIYVPQGLIGEVCRKHGVRVVNWNPAYRKSCFIFSHGNTYHHTMISEPVSVWENLVWNPSLDQGTMEYLKSRWHGTYDWFWFHDRPEEDPEKIKNEIGIDLSRPCITLLSNVIWDAQLHYRSNAFPGMLEWVVKTIRYFKNRTDLQLVIRVHPAELRGLLPSRQPLVDEIKKIFPSLPSNVFIVPPESQVSTYKLAEMSNAVLIYNTKTGIELSSMGIPVVVAGEAWIRNKGFSLDATNEPEFFKILDRLPLDSRLDAPLIERARKYAFHFFYRRMIPVPVITTVANNAAQFNLELTSVQELSPGSFPGLDCICDGIITGSTFVFPAEQYIGHKEEFLPE